MTNILEEASANNLVFFDGICVLCNGFVDFFLSKDNNHRLTFVALQSEFAKKLAADQTIQVNHENYQTVLFLKDGKFYQKSQAVSLILHELGGIYALCGKIISWTPTAVADWIYSFIARYRYKIFGRKTGCRVPSPAEKPYIIV